MSNVLSLEELEAGVSMFSILSAFLLVAMIFNISLVIYTILKKKTLKKKIIVLETICLVLIVFSLFNVNNATHNIVKDIVANYPKAGYFLN